jgi:hypothetical protein
VPGFAQATRVEVNYTIEGQRGDWTMDFSLRNNIQFGSAHADFTLYKFGVALPESHIIDQPAAWSAAAPFSASGVTFTYVRDYFIAQVFLTMHENPRHTFQILTKRGVAKVTTTDTQITSGTPGL